jgi:hypothetical protein
MENGKRRLGRGGSGEDVMVAIDNGRRGREGVEEAVGSLHEGRVGLAVLMLLAAKEQLEEQTHLPLVLPCRLGGAYLLEDHS